MSSILINSQVEQGHNKQKIENDISRITQPLLNYELIKDELMQY